MRDTKCVSYKVTEKEKGWVEHISLHGLRKNFKTFVKCETSIFHYKIKGSLPNPTHLNLHWIT